MRRENEFRYLQLAHILKEQILSGFIKPGEFLMSENELCKYYGMSRTSVRKSLEQLLKEGLIVKKVGQGTIVSPDLVLETPKNKVLRIFTTTPSNFFDHCMPFLIEEFQKENPHVEVKCLPFSSGDYWESIRTSVELGLQPDLIFLSDQQFGAAENLNQFADLQGPLSGHSDSIYSRLRDAFSYEGRLKALPVTFSTVYLAYNPDLFQRYGVAEPSEHWTKEDFLKAAKQLTMDTNGDGISDLYGLTLSSALSRWPAIALQNGVQFKSADILRAMTKTLEFLHELLYIHRAAMLSTRPELIFEAFMKEKTAMVLTTSIELAGWTAEAIEFTPKVAPLPFGDLKDTLLIANAFMVPSGSNEPELANRFMQKAIEPAVQERFSRMDGFISVLPSINEEVWSSSLLESLHIHQKTIENSYFLHEMFDDVNIVDEIQKEMVLYWAGLYSAAEMAEHMEHILSKASE